ncbi:MAG TPA: formate dehydrogenase accessory protein FdhE, partial [Vicinamibacterales bacterium]|nr:formate dehydrogenase accessory protein FdhE [Vicinamibacterales bacterium]
TGPPSTGSRALPRDVVELKALAERQPALAPAATLQIDLIEAVRRVQGRITTPWIDTTAETLRARLASGQPLLDFSQIAFDWNDVRLLIRQITDVLRRHEVVDAPTATALHAIGRSPTLPDVMRSWFEQETLMDIEMLGEVLAWAARPYLQRTSEVLQQRVSLEQWTQRICPICAAEPEFSVITSTGERQLVCGRCHARWLFNPIACPYCGNDNRTTIRSMATPDGVYRVMVCSPCGRYIKALDTRKSPRPLLPYLDLIATLPLDAAVMKT